MQNKILNPEEFDPHQVTEISMERYYTQDNKYLDKPIKEVGVQTFLPIDVIKKAIARAEKIFINTKYESDEIKRENLLKKIDKLIQKNIWESKSFETLNEKLNYLKIEKIISRASYFRYKKQLKSELEEELEIQDALEK